jgi:hypothetical protein
VYEKPLAIGGADLIVRVVPILLQNYFGLAAQTFGNGYFITRRLTAVA